MCWRLVDELAVEHKPAGIPVSLEKIRKAAKEADLWVGDLCNPILAKNGEYALAEPEFKMYDSIVRRLWSAVTGKPTQLARFPENQYIIFRPEDGLMISSTCVWVTEDTIVYVPYLTTPDDKASVEGGDEDYERLTSLLCEALGIAPITVNL